MRYAAVLLICAAAAVPGSFGQGTVFLDSPRDDRRARTDIASRDELEAPRALYDALAKDIRASSRSDILRVCGPPLSRRPESAVRPIFGPPAYGLPGIMIRPSNGLFSLGDIGFADVQFDDEHVVAVIVYLRADESFVPLRSAHDFEARLTWDVRRLEQVRHWWAEHSSSASRPST